MPRIRTSSAPELLLSVDRTASEPGHRQVARGLRDAIRGGRLRSGARLPSTRALARELGVSRGLVVEVYDQLSAEGYLAIRPGGLTRVARTAVRSARAHRASEPLTFEIDFRPGRPDVAAFPRDAWLRSMRRSLASAPSSRLTYLDGRGLPELRVELANYLNRVRGTAAVPDDIVITVGFAQGIWLVSMALAEEGARRFAVEDPSLGDSWRVVEAAGLKVAGIPLDADGLRVDLLEKARVSGVLITPAHQYPTGRVLSAGRRAALFAWAERRKGVIVEDDYDAEYRYDRQPVGAMQGLRPDRVVYAGSLSKVLAPGLRLDWLVAPPELAGRIADVKKAMDNGSPIMDQLAFADFIARGELDRHLRRMRPIYRRRRDLVVAALARHLPELQPVGAAAGLHVLTWLHPTDDPAAIVAAAAQSGIGLGHVEPGTGGDPRSPGGLVFGYGTISESSIEPGIRRLARLIDAHGAAA